MNEHSKNKTAGTVLTVGALAAALSGWGLLIAVPLAAGGIYFLRR